MMALLTGYWLLATSDTFYKHSRVTHTTIWLLNYNVKIDLAQSIFSAFKEKLLLSVKHFNYFECTLKGVKNFISTPSQARGCSTNSSVTD